MIEISGVGKVYGKKESAFVALRDVNISIPEKATVAIIGKSGSGKSTLMHIMSGLDKASEGEVLVDNRKLHSMKRKEIDQFRAHRIGFIFQSFFIEGNHTCYQNVVLPLEIAEYSPRRRRARVLKALEQVGLDDKIDQKAKNLSGGQKQRLAIARAIVNKPMYIFADEPTGNLDSVNGNKVIDLLFDLNKRLGSTLCIVTHDIDLAKRCQLHILIKDGSVVMARKKPSGAKI